MHNINYKESILNYFISLDIDNLRVQLRNEYTYQDTSKEIFLDEVAKIFEAHKNSGDTELIIYQGRCAGKICENCGKKGFRFVGNNSKNYFDLLFEIEGDDIKDIYSCSRFETDVEIEGLQAKADIDIMFDDRVTVHKTPEYWSKVNAANVAFTEIIALPPKLLNFRDLCYWVDKHSITDSLIGSYDVFMPQRRWTPFSSLYEELKKIRSYIAKYLNEIIQANFQSTNIVTEQDQIDWLLKYEVTYRDAPTDLICHFVVEGDYYKLHKRNPILFQGEEFMETMAFIEFYQKKDEQLLNKYTTYTHAEESELYEKIDWKNKERPNIFSLRFQIENRKAMKEIGIDLPQYINKKGKLP